MLFFYLEFYWHVQIGLFDKVGYCFLRCQCIYQTFKSPECLLSFTVWLFFQTLSHYPTIPMCNHTVYLNNFSSINWLKSGGCFLSVFVLVFTIQSVFFNLVPLEGDEDAQFIQYTVILYTVCVISYGVMVLVEVCLINGIYL